MNRARYFLLLSVLLASAGPLPAEEGQLYLAEIKPLLRARCYACHGVLKQESDMRLDTAQQMHDAGILKSGKLLARVTSNDLDHRMPPEGEPLEAEQIASIRKWIAAGAAVPRDEVAEIAPQDHWAFQRIERPALATSILRNYWNNSASSTTYGCRTLTSSP